MTDRAPVRPDDAGALGWLVEAARVRDRAGLRRTLAVRPASPTGPASDAPLLDLAANDYLGLSRDPRVLDGAVTATRRWGAGATSSRLVAGTTRLHTDLEDAVAGFLGVEAALVFSSGYLANVGVISALMGRGDLIVSDGGAHASLIDGCRLSRARVVVTDRGDYDAVRTALARRLEPRAMVVTDSVYSTDGALAPVAQMYAAASDCGAALLVDEAHALGVRGPGGRGVLAELGLAGATDVIATTVLSKSLGAQGGVVAGSRMLRDHLVDRARTFIFDTGLAPSAAGAALAALRILTDEPWLPDRVRANAERLAHACGGAVADAAVVSMIVGDPDRAVAAARACRDAGVLVGCFRPPSVPPGTARLRLTARADLTTAELARGGAVAVEAVATARAHPPTPAPQGEPWRS